MSDSGQVRRVLIWRAWQPLYPFDATQAAIATSSMGGTCTQLLWHAKSLSAKGLSVQILGATRSDVVEDGAEFVGSMSRRDQERSVANGRIAKPDMILLEGAFAAAPYFRDVFPDAIIVHVGQNIDRGGAARAFRHTSSIDLHAMVGPGQLAFYCHRVPSLRAKFVLLRNVVPWESMYRSIPARTAARQVAWVGAWGKKGLRDWVLTMRDVLADDRDLRWVLYGPSHGTGTPPSPPPEIFDGLRAMRDRIDVRSLPMPQLYAELSESSVVLVSLGNECGPISTLDAHAASRPVVSGNDMVYKYANPDCAGIRVTRTRERRAAVQTLLADPDLCDAIGRFGRNVVLAEYTERALAADLDHLLAHASMLRRFRHIPSFVPDSAIADRWRDARDRARRIMLRAKRVRVLGGRT